MQTFSSREEWLRERGKRIGGSDAAAIIGCHPFMTNVDLWEQKTGRYVPEEKDSPWLRYGTNAENYLRGLFALDFPQYEVGYAENNMWTNDKYPFAHASLDGWLHDEDGRLGVLEIKTANIINPDQKLKWKNRIPDNYYIQVLWYMGVVEAEFAVLKAQLKWDNGDSVFCVTKHYRIELEDVQPDIDLLFNAGEKFYKYYVESDKMPPLVLPQI